MGDAKRGEERVALVMSEQSVDCLTLLAQSLSGCLRELEAEMLCLRHRTNWPAQREQDIRRAERRVSQLQTLVGLLRHVGSELEDAVSSLPCRPE